MRSKGGTDVRSDMTGKGTHILRVALQGEPAILREIEIGSDKRLFDLARTIVRAFDFDFDHAFGFYSKLTGRDVMHAQPRYELFVDMGESEDSGSVKRTRVSEACPVVGHQMLFLFDYGDDWRFVVTVIRFGKKQPNARYPKVLRKSGPSPEQYPDWNDDAQEYGDDDEPRRIN